MKRLRNLALGLILALTPGCCLMWDVTNGSHSIAPGCREGPRHRTTFSIVDKVHALLTRSASGRTRAIVTRADRRSSQQKAS